MAAPLPVPARPLWLRLSGLIPVAVVAAPVVVAIIGNPTLLARRHIVGWLVAITIFVACYLAATTSARVRRSSQWALTLVLIQSLAALAAIGHIPTPFAGVSIGGILLVVVAGQLPYLLATPPSIAWLIAQSLALAIIYTRIAEWPIPISLVAAAAYFAFQLFAFFAASAAYREACARVELAAANERLRQTQRDLALASAAAERARLWRELHDVLGHHLAALSLHLEAAANLTEGRSQDLVRRARALSRLMLADIRSVMSETQPSPADAADRPTADFASEFCAIGLDPPLPGLQVHHELAPDLPPLAQETAHALLRAAQECVTNAARHAAARDVRLHLTRDHESLILTARDDGAGAHSFREGSGLSAMRDRIARLGGTLTITTAPGAGFEVRIAVPLAARSLERAA